MAKKINAPASASTDSRFDSTSFGALKDKTINKKNTKSYKNKSDKAILTTPADDNNDDISDPRFSSLHRNPKFKKTGASGVSKIVLDPRFAGVLTDDRFKVAPGDNIVDRYGRTKKEKNKSEKAMGVKGGDGVESELSAFYEIEGVEKRKVTSKKEEPEESASDSDSDSDSSTLSTSSKTKKNQTPDQRLAYLNSLSRGDVALSSDSDGVDSDASIDSESDSNADSDSDSDDSFGEHEEEEEGILSLREKPELVTNLETCYLALMNFEWDTVKASDIFVLISSFAPPGSLVRVSVYPSDFGRERMERDLTEGPRGLWKEDEKGEVKGEEYDEEDFGNPQGGSDDDAEEEEEEEGDEEEDGEEGEGSDEDDEEDEEIDAGAASDSNSDSNTIKQKGESHEQLIDSDFDSEKLRTYEASKLKYYFALAEFTSTSSCSTAYYALDGVELEHSSCAIDVRAIPEDVVPGVTKDREQRDTSNSIPLTYTAPNMVSKALQQSKVECTWEAGDDERQKKLSKWGVGQDTWKAMADGDDLNAYIASDDSSSDEEEEEDDEDGGKKKKSESKKAANMRKLLLGGGGGGSDSSDSDSGSGSEEESSDDSDLESEVEGNMEMTISSSALGLSERMRAKAAGKPAEEALEELTPWEKFQLKRKEKRKQKKAELKKGKKNGVANADADSDSDGDNVLGGSEDDDEIPDWAQEDDNDNDNFFLCGANDDIGRKKKDKKRREPLLTSAGAKGTGAKPSSKEVLSKLIDGDDDEERDRDFDMRGIARMDAMKNKKLTGNRKKKEDLKASTVTGKDFTINTSDDRFAAVLNGDDARFGIDKLNPSFKETEGMRIILEEQGKRRAKKRKNGRKGGSAADDGKKAKTETAEIGVAGGAGAMALSALVNSIKSKVAAKPLQKKGLL